MLLERVGVDVVHAQARHHFGVDLRAKADLAALAALDHQHVGYHDVALDIHEAAPGLGLQAGDHGDCFAHGGVRCIAELHETLHVAARQQPHRLRADALRHRDHRQLRRALRQRPCQRVELQRQTLGQIGGANAHRVETLQYPQGDGEVVQQLLHLLVVVGAQARSQRLQRVLQIAVLVERLDQEAKGDPVGVAQARGQRLRVQVRLERLLRARQFAGVDFILCAQIVAVRLGVAAPFTVIGGDFHRAVAVPAFAVGGAQRRHLFVLGRATTVRAVLHGEGRAELGLLVGLTHRRVDLRQTKLLASRRFFGHLQKGVFVEHLAHFLAQFERRELQQADRLLQLRRECQMLRDAQRKSGLHCGCAMATF